MVIYCDFYTLAKKVARTNLIFIQNATNQNFRNDSKVKSSNEYESNVSVGKT